MTTTKTTWRRLNRKMYGYACLSLCIGDSNHVLENAIIGEYGEIWTNGSGRAKCYLVSNGGNYEKIISFDVKDLQKYLLKIKLTSPTRQMELAKNPNLRLSNDTA